MANPRVVFVDVFIESITPLRHRVEPSVKNNPQLPVDPDGNIIFENDHHPGFEIHFEFQGDTHGYFFPPTATKVRRGLVAMWQPMSRSSWSVGGVSADPDRFVR